MIGLLEAAPRAVWRLAFAVNAGFLLVNYFQDDTRGMLFSGFVAIFCMPLAFRVAKSPSGIA